MAMSDLHLRRRTGRLRRRAAAQEGFTLIEVLVAVLVLTIGIITLVAAFDSSRRLSTRDEERQTASAVAEREVQRIQALPWSQIALKSTPTTNSGAGAKDPTHYISNGPCPDNGPVSSPCYQWDWNSSSSIEPMVIDTLNGDSTANPTPWSTTIIAGGSTVRLSGNVYRYITWVNDANCTLASCLPSSDPKRIFVAVTVSGLTTPITLAAVADNNVGGSKNGLTEGVTCIDGSTTNAQCVH
jgi:prepilin-type N-terminal cleavage/methylation domain-containing protein